MPEQFCDAGDGITLCYETFGDPGDPPLLLIMGLASQMIAWNEGFCEMLAERGFYVIRFDNRDVGLSTRMDYRAPTTLQLALRRFHPRQYLLSDMARDTVGLLDCLGLESVHVAGASMGGMIAQTLAIEHPERVRSLVSMMSNTGRRRAGQPALHVYLHFLRRPPTSREATVSQLLTLFRMVGSRGRLRDLDEIRDRVERSFDRAHDPAGAARQLAAILASGSRHRRLAEVRVPTTVIHGTADRLVRPSGGRATADAIPGAELILFKDMGHDLPRLLWPRLTVAIADTAARAGAELRPLEVEATAG